MNHLEVLRNLLGEDFPAECCGPCGLEFKHCLLLFTFLHFFLLSPPFFLKKEWQDLYVMLKASLNTYLSKKKASLNTVFIYHISMRVLVFMGKILYHGINFAWICHMW